MKFIGCFNKSVCLTYLGVFFSLSGIFNLLIMNPFESINRIDIAIIYMVLAGICDLFDGFIARKCKRNETQKQFGIQIDSLADIISFVIYPIILLFFLVDKQYYNIYLYLSIFYIITGITRLAWFNIKTDGNINYYQGLPVTYVSLIIPVLYTINSYITIPFWDILICIVYTLVGFLFILDIKIKKPRGIWYILFSLLAIITIVLLIF